MLIVSGDSDRSGDRNVEILQMSEEIIKLLPDELDYDDIIDKYPC